MAILPYYKYAKNGSPRKRVLSALLAVLLLLGCLGAAETEAYAYPTGYPNTHVNTGNQRADVVAIARTQVGYTEDSSGTKYGAWWKEYNHTSYNYTTAPWCAMFVLWCENQAGCEAATKGMTASSSGMHQYYKNEKNGNVAYSFGSGYMPRPGDIIFVGYKGYSTPDHVGLIVDIDDSTIYTIEGNYLNQVYRVSYSLATGCRKNSSRAIVAFGVPAYRGDSDAGFDGPVQKEETDEALEVIAADYETAVTSSSLNVRALPSSSSTVKDTLKRGEKVHIIAEYNAGSHLWGKLEQGGWICLYYTEVGDDGQEYFTKEPEDAEPPEAPEEPGTTEDPAEQDTPDAPLEAPEPAEAEEPEAPEAPAGQVIFSGIVNCSSLNVRVGAGTGYGITSVLKGGSHVELEEYQDVNGVRWGRLTTGGWVCTKYLTSDSEVSGTEPGTPPASEIRGTVTASTLNVRTEPVSGRIVATLKRGTAVTVTETKTAGGSEWGRISSGWISMNYVKTDSTPDATVGESAETPAEAATTEPEIPSEPTVPAAEIHGTVTASTLNVRSEPVTGRILTTLKRGTSVTVTETRTVSGTQWGRISSGWISMAYVNTEQPAEEAPAEPKSEPEKEPAPENGPETEQPAPQESYGDSPYSSGVSEASEGTEVGEPETEIRGTVTASTLNVRSEPVTGRIVTTLKRGASVTVTETKTVNGTEWGRISTGWISMVYVNPESISSPAPTAAGTDYTVTGTNVNVRSGAGTGYAILRTVTRGDVLTITETKNAGGTTWGCIAGGGWISMKYLTKAA